MLDIVVAEVEFDAISKVFQNIADEEKREKILLRISYHKFLHIILYNFGFLHVIDVLSIEDDLKEITISRIEREG